MCCAVVPCSQAPAGAVAQAGASQSSPYPTAEPRGHSSPGGPSVCLSSVLPRDLGKTHDLWVCLLSWLHRNQVVKVAHHGARQRLGGTHRAGVGEGAAQSTRGGRRPAPGPPALFGHSALPLHRRVPAHVPPTGACPCPVRPWVHPVTATAPPLPARRRCPPRE